MRYDVQYGAGYHIQCSNKRVAIATVKDLLKTWSQVTISKIKKIKR